MFDAFEIKITQMVYLLLRFDAVFFSFLLINFGSKGAWPG